MANQDLFKQAIAEAKTIREVAISNAKEVLEETITPHLKELLAVKLQEMEEEDAEDMLYEKEEEEAEVEAGDEAEGGEEGEESEEAPEEEEELDVKDMEIEDLKNLIRDIVSQEMGGAGVEGEEEMTPDMESPDAEAQPEDMGGAEDEEINLEELLAELEGMTSTSQELDERYFGHGNNRAKNIKRGNKERGAARDAEAAEKIAKEKEEMKKKEEEEKKKKDKELNEALSTIKELRTQLSEINTLNAKLLYLNKVLRFNNLSESQKATIITAFDKATNVKEVKLVYEAVVDSFDVKSNPKKRITESRSFASAPQGYSTRPKVVEVDEQVLRMQKLAGIIK